MDDLLGVLWIVVAVGVSAGAMFWFRRGRVVDRYLRRARRYSIADFPEGVAGRTSGFVRAVGDDGMTTPMTGRPCLFYSITFSIHTPGMSVYTQNRWHIVGRRTSAVPFELEDSTGRALIEPEGALVYGFAGASNGAVLRTPTEAQKAYLARVGINWRSDLQFNETILRAGDLISVVGAAHREPNPDPATTEGYRADRPTRLQISTSRTYQLMFFDQVPE